MLLQMKWLIVCCSMAAMVFIAAVKQDDCDPGDQPPAPNSRADSKSVPRAFMDRPALAEMLQNVPMHLRTRDEILKDLFRQHAGPREDLLRRMVAADCSDMQYDGNVTACLEDAAYVLELFRRDTAEAEDEATSDNR